MKELSYSIGIQADAKKVWETMISPETFQRWNMPFSPNLKFEGIWGQGEEIKFFDPPNGGTVATLTEFSQYDRMVTEHTAILSADGKKTTTGDAAEKWIGTEEYLRILPVR